MTSPCETHGLRNCAEPQRCRLTVVRKDFNRDLYDACPYGAAAACTRFEVGQTFVTDNRWDPPAGFCSWAWGDLRPLIAAVHSGNPVPMIACCTDGLRPVFFRLERHI